jgi:hypothetical protein
MKMKKIVPGMENVILQEMAANATTQIIIGPATTALFTTVALNCHQTQSVSPTHAIFIAITWVFATQREAPAFATRPRTASPWTIASLLTALAPTTTSPRPLRPRSALPPWSRHCLQQPRPVYRRPKIQQNNQQ